MAAIQPKIRHINIEENEVLVIHAPSITLQVLAMPRGAACSSDPKHNPWNYDCVRLTHLKKKLKTRLVYLLEDHSNLHLCLCAMEAYSDLTWENPPTSDVEKGMARVLWFVPFRTRINNAWGWKSDIDCIPKPPPLKVTSQGNMEPYIPDKLEDSLAFILSLTLPDHWEAPPCFRYLPGEEDWEYTKEKELEAWVDYLERQSKASWWTLDLKELADATNSTCYVMPSLLLQVTPAGEMSVFNASMASGAHVMRSGHIFAKWTSAFIQPATAAFDLESTIVKVASDASGVPSDFVDLPFLISSASSPLSSKLSLPHISGTTSPLNTAGIMALDLLEVNRHLGSPTPGFKCSAESPAPTPSGSFEMVKKNVRCRHGRGRNSVKAKSTSSAHSDPSIHSIPSQPFTFQSPLKPPLAPKVASHVKSHAHRASKHCRVDAVGYRVPAKHLERIVEQAAPVSTSLDTDRMHAYTSGYIGKERVAPRAADHTWSLNELDFTTIVDASQCVFGAVIPPPRAAGGSGGPDPTFLAATDECANFLSAINPSCSSTATVHQRPHLRLLASLLAVVKRYIIALYQSLAHR
ncbi:hypothetical protein BT96DRAFT_951274 [Gymnopus androsaceus JB14]|uniref:Uncharacterized protein n=1 Tax=Gymnopus androsaceus JB14 TaxID=1447944 RepID=A0A6A4GDJ4_9AGAR|nr:hypothetical protein BT96DRAFT_951274 [Gymnopus androsaceus JB14]